MDAAASLGLEPDLLALLDRLALRIQRPIPGHSAGRRRSPRTGSSVEFADYRTYVPGDDVRRLDWNVYARLDRLLLRLSVAEEDVTVSLLLDVSASMEWGDPAKALRARGIAGALAHIATRSDDRVAIAGFADRLAGRLPALRGRAGSRRAWDLLAGLPSGGATDFGVVATLAGALPRGICVMISDFLTESDPEPAVAALRASGKEVVLLQVLTPQELRPDLSGDVRLRDVESGASVEITATPAVLVAYAAALDEHELRLMAMATAHGATVCRVTSDTPLQTLLLRDLRQAGVLR